MRLIEVDDDEVGALAGLERAGDGLAVQRTRAETRSHGKRLTGR
jgi:hypothetical protein